MRKGQKFTRPALVTATGISKKYLQSLEDGSRGFPGKSSRDALSQALGFQFFLL